MAHSSVIDNPALFIVGDDTRRSATNDYWQLKATKVPQAIRIKSDRFLRCLKKVFLNSQSGERGIAIEGIRNLKDVFF